MFRCISIFTLSLFATVSLVEAKKFNMPELWKMPMYKAVTVLKKRMEELENIDHKEKAKNPDFLEAHQARKTAITMALGEDFKPAMTLYVEAQETIDALNLPTKRERAKNHIRSAFAEKLATQAIDNNLSIEAVMIQQKVKPAKIIELKRSGDFLWIREQLEAEKKLSLKKEGNQKFNILELLDMPQADRMVSLMKRKEELDNVDHKEKAKNPDFLEAHQTRKTAIAKALGGDFENAVTLYMEAQEAINVLNLPTKRERAKNHIPSDPAMSRAKLGIDNNLSIKEICKEYLYPFEIDELKRSGDFLWIREELEAAKKLPLASPKEKGKEKIKERENSKVDEESEESKGYESDEEKVLTSNERLVKSVPVTPLLTWMDILGDSSIPGRSWENILGTPFAPMLTWGDVLNEMQVSKTHEKIGIIWNEIWEYENIDVFLNAFQGRTGKAKDNMQEIILPLSCKAIEIRERYEDKDLFVEEERNYFIELAKCKPELVGRFAVCYKLDNLETPFFLVYKGLLKK